MASKLINLIDSDPQLSRRRVYWFGQAESTGRKNTMIGNLLGEAIIAAKRRGIYTDPKERSSAKKELLRQFGRF